MQASARTDDNPASKANILLVDDQPANLLVLRTILEDLGQNLVEAGSGEEALRRLLSDDFAVILLDVQMPGLDGFETARLIRSRERFRQTPIIFLTGYEDNRLSVEEAYALGAVDYLVKPLVPIILRAKVTGFIELFEKTEQIKRLRQVERREFEQRLAEENARLRASQEALREADRRKDQFLAILAHELRNPLAALVNATQIVSRVGRGNEGFRSALQILERQLKHLGRLVDDLLDVSRITTGKIQLYKEEVELATIVAHAVETSRPLLDARKHDFKVSLPDEPLWLKVDPTRLAQVLSNLLTNAAKYTGESGRINLTAERQGEQAMVRVRDTGIGIPEEMLPRIFTLFTQGNRTLPGSGGGLGIGLSIARKLVEMHGGSVEVSSPGPGQGSEFLVRLPLIQARQQAKAPKTDHALPEEACSRRVLVVDDNLDAAESLAMLVREMGHEVRVAHEGSSALKTADNFQPELVLLDIGLPVMDGYEVARNLRKQPGLERILLVALTGYGQDEDRRRSQEAGFDHHLVKPLEPESLQRIMTKLN
jgi:signal transduction histidine kinase